MPQKKDKRQEVFEEPTQTEQTKKELSGEDDGMTQANVIALGNH